MPADGAPRHAPARTSRGTYARTLDSIERDREAASLITQGWSYQQAADHLGYSDAGTCWRAVQLIRRERARLDGTSEQLRQQQLAEMAELKRRLWDQLNNPLPAVDRLGRIVHDDDGNPVPDAAAIAATEAPLVKVSERIARIRHRRPPPLRQPHRQGRRQRDHRRPRARQPRRPHRSHRNQAPPARRSRTRSRRSRSSRQGHPRHRRAIAAPQNRASVMTAPILAGNFPGIS